MSTYEHVLFEAWIHGMITDNEFALAWTLEQHCNPRTIRQQLDA
jgi:hypothetical protein